MDAFESLIALLLSREGYWVRPNLKVELTKAEKRRIDRPSSPRWEIDLVAYKGAMNEILAVECKSYLDSPGVRLGALDGTRPSKRYKLFREPKLWKVVSARLVKQLTEQGACRSRPRVTLCLAAGKLARPLDRDAMHQLFQKRGWRLFDDEWVRERLRATASSGYENEVALVVAKILERGRS